MRVFDETEKNIIQKITDGVGFSRNYINILDSIHTLQGVVISIDPVNKNAQMRFTISGTTQTPTEFDAATKRYPRILERLAQQAILIQYLEKEDLVYVFSPVASQSSPISMGAGAVNMSALSMPINDRKLIDLLIYFAHKEIMPSPSLKQLAKNHYRTEEEIRFSRQSRLTWVAILIPTAVGAMGLFNDYQSSISLDKQFNQQLMANQKNVETLTSSLLASDALIIDYRDTIDGVSTELSKISNKVDLVPSVQTIQVELVTQEQKLPPTEQQTQ